jgi:GTP cyclohydrolase I
LVFQNEEKLLNIIQKRPQLQERLTMQIVQEFKNALGTKTLPALLTQNIS